MGHIVAEFSVVLPPSLDCASVGESSRLLRLCWLVHCIPHLGSALCRLFSGGDSKRVLHRVPWLVSESELLAYLNLLSPGRSGCPTLTALRARESPVLFHF